MKKLISLLSILAVSGNCLFAQNNAKTSSNLIDPSAEPGNTGNKPTDNLQQCIATSRYVFNGKVDTLRYTYTGERGTVPLPHGLETVPYGSSISSQYDTFYNTNNNGISFFVDHVRSYTADNKPANTKYFNESGTYTGQETYYYSQSGADSLYTRSLNFNATDFSFQTTYYNSNGLMVYDTISQHVQGDDIYNFYRKTTREYDNQNRKTRSYSYNYNYGFDNLLNTDIKYYFEGNSSQPYLDSITRYSGPIANQTLARTYIKFSYDANEQILADSNFNAADGSLNSFDLYTYAPNLSETMRYTMDNGVAMPVLKIKFHINNNGDTVARESYDPEMSDVNNMILYALDSFKYNNHYIISMKKYERTCDTCALYFSTEMVISRNSNNNPISINTKKYLENGIVADNKSDYFYYADENVATGIANLSNTQDISIYPVPVNGNLFIDQTKTLLSTSCVKVINTAGMKVLDKQLVAVKETINMQALAPGLYLLQFYDKKGTILYTKKIIKN